MLSYRRPHGSATEADFIAKYLDSVPGMTSDGFGNRYLRLGHSRTLFSCHIDTVHGTDGMQEVIYDAELDLAYKQDHQPLGADDTAGLWLLLHLIKHRVPGLYVFHRAEERGGQGSTYIASHTPELLRDIDRAIAFDRRGRKDVITHQAGVRCCSDVFAKALARELDLGHQPSSHGIFTDTANYTELIPECTNISVGYDGEHTGSEVLDFDYLHELADAVLDVDWEKLPTSREPRIEDLFDWETDYPALLEELTYNDLVDYYPEEAARLLELCNPNLDLIRKAFDDVKSLSTFNDTWYNR